MLPMTLAAALELVLNQYDIFDVDDLVAILRSPVDATLKWLTSSTRAASRSMRQRIQPTSVCRQRRRQRRWAQRWTALSTPCVR